MVASFATFAVAATSAFSLVSISSAQHIASATYTGTVGLNKPKNEGCYSNSQPLENHGTYGFQSLGNCQLICVGLHKPVLGLTNGNECWCGDKLPALEYKIDDSNCQTGCSGYDSKPCGGYHAWLVYTSGWSLNAIPHLPGNQVTSKSKAPQTHASHHTTSVVTEKDHTVTVHAPAATTISSNRDKGSHNVTSSDSSSSDGTNTTAVVAGVVIGIVVLTAIVAGVYFWMRRKRRMESDEKARQEAAVAGFMEAGRKAPTTSSSMNDFRLDPDATARRQSSGSIADNEDFSRRILQVTNPDRPPKAFRDSRF